MKSFLISFFTFLLFLSGNSQELNCNVQVLTPQIQGDKKIYETLQNGIFEFMNNTKWTKDNFQNDERIPLTLIITINERVSDEFKATMQVQSSRTAYRSSYNSVLFNHNETDFTFRYLEFQPLEFSENTNMSNLTSVLAFYAYMAIGIDYDSFSPEGGTQYFRRAQTIVANAQNAPEKGWKAFEGSKNRYWLVENATNETFAPLRECFYRYHRFGLDIMHQDVVEGRKAILDAIELLRKVHKDKPGSFNLQIFFNAKSDEIVNIFSKAFPDEKSKVVNILNEIDPANSIKYAKILTSN